MPTVNLSLAEYEALKQKAEGAHVKKNKTSVSKKKKRSPKPCPDGKIRHRKTGRCRKIRPKAELGPCPDGKIRDPDTRRCRNLKEIAEAVIAKRNAKKTAKAADGEKRPLNSYQQHMKDTIAKFKEMEARGTIEPMSYKERFRAAVQAWRDLKSSE